jgi:hypothetical protein
MIAMVAFAIDVGYLCMARSQAQNCADASALAAALEMTDNDNLKLEMAARIEAARTKAIECAALQDINFSLSGTTSGEAPSVIESVRFGRLEDPNNPNEPLSFASPDNPNAVEVRVVCDPARNTAIPLFFARIFGTNTARVSASAIAAFTTEQTTGFNSEPETACTLMPFAIKESDWNNLLANGNSDNWTYDPKTKTVSPGPDGIPELKMFPARDEGGHGGITPGNFGTVDIGPMNNGAPDMLRQIRFGPSTDDLAYHGGVLRLDPVTNTVELTGTAPLEINGDTGITASMKDALGDVIGKPRTIMVYNHVVGNGDNAMFTVPRFVGVRVLDFKTTGAARDKYILVQPAMVQDKSAVADGDTQTSNFVGQPVHLVR